MQNGYVILVVRRQMQLRQGVPYARTVGTYETFYDTNPTGLSGAIVERQGPGDNSITGKKGHSRIAAGQYPLFTHASPPDADGVINYKTVGYQTGQAPSVKPRPCLEVGATGERNGILIHPASGFLMSIGCFNPSAPLPSGDANVSWADSKARVISIIDDLRSHVEAAFPESNNARIPGAWINVEGEP